MKKIKDKIIFIKNIESLGFGRANNKGIKITKGKYVFLLNSIIKRKDIKNLDSKNNKQYSNIRKFKYFTTGNRRFSDSTE